MVPLRDRVASLRTGAVGEERKRLKDRTSPLTTCGRTWGRGAKRELQPRVPLREMTDFLFSPQ